MTNVKVLKSKKGFTLIELIVVMAILAVLAAIAIPKFNTMRYAATVNADASQAASLINACRVQETQTGAIVEVLVPTTGKTELKSSFMVVPTSQSGGTYALITGGGGASPYVITFTPAAGFTPYNKLQTVTEHVKFVINE